jgi:hypothetical protein
MEMLEGRESEMWEWAYRLAEQTGPISDSKYARDQIDNMCRKAREAKGKAGQ